MSDDERKPRVHIHTGGLIIFIIILLILFKVDIASKIKSLQFQENIKFIQTETTKFWNDYVMFPMKTKSADWLKNTANTAIDSGVNKIESEISNKLLKTDQIDKLTQ